MLPVYYPPESDADNFDILGKNIAGLCASKQNVTASRLAIGDIMGECSYCPDFGKTTLTEGNDVKMALRYVRFVQS